MHPHRLARALASPGGEHALALASANLFIFVFMSVLKLFLVHPTLFFQDNGEGRRLGTLVVWLDDGIESDEPLLAVPINLSVLLDLPQDQARESRSIVGGPKVAIWRAFASFGDPLERYFCHFVLLTYVAL